MQDTSPPNRTLDLASALEVGSAGARASGDCGDSPYNLRSVLTIAFQFTYLNHVQDNVAAMARQYICHVIEYVQRVSIALAPSLQSPHLGPRPPPGTPEALTLTHWICQSYR